jgi:hypothetical protein
VKGRRLNALSVVEGVRDLDLVNRSVLVLDLDGKVLSLGEGVEAEDLRAARRKQAGGSAPSTEKMGENQEQNSRRSCQ